MTTEVATAALRIGLDRRLSGKRPRLEHVVMGAAIIALVVLVVLPLLSLLLGSVRSDHGLSLDHFSEVLSERLYVTALNNSLILGAWTGKFSLLIGLVLAWAVARTDVPAKPLIQITATLSYPSPPFLTAIALTYLFSPNAGLINVLLRDVAGLPWLTFNIFSMAGLVLVTVMHTFPFVCLLASSALMSVDASYEEAAQILGAGKLRTSLSITAPLVAPAILSGTLLAFVNALALFGSQAIIGLPGRIFTLPTRIYALFDYPPEYGLASALSLVLVLITGVAPPTRVPGAVLLHHSRRQGRTAAIDAARPFPLGVARLRGADLHRLHRRPLYDADRGVVLQILGARFLEGTYARQLPVHPPGVQRHPACHLQQFDPGGHRRDHCCPAGRRDRLDLPAHPHPRPQAARLCFAHSARAPRDRGGGCAHPVLAAMPLALYGTLAILLLAYVGRYIPLGVRAANSSLRQVDPSLEESAQILGASWATTMREITLPLIRPGLFAGWLLVFVPVIQELSASILLFSSSSITLAVAVYNLYETGYIEPVAALAMINMGIIGVAIWLAHRIGGGRIAQYGTPFDVYTRPADRMVADFMGLVNLVPGNVGEVANGGRKVELGAGLAPGDSVDVAIRPENIRLRAGAGVAGAARARITNHVFLGNISEYYATLASGWVFRVQTHPLQQFEIGDEVAVEVDARQCTVFRREIGDAIAS